MTKTRSEMAAVLGGMSRVAEGLREERLSADEQVPDMMQDLGHVTAGGFEILPEEPESPVRGPAGKLPERWVGSEADRLREVRETARARLAEDLVKILTQETVCADPDLKSRMEEVAEAALAAAQAIYPKPQEGAGTP